MGSDALIVFDSCDLGSPDRQGVTDFDWTVRPGECWLVTGANGSGKSVLAAVLAGTAECRIRDGGAAVLPPAGAVALVSMEAAAALIEEERAKDDSDFVEGGMDPGTTARRYLESFAAGATATGASPAGVRAERLISQIDR